MDERKEREDSEGRAEAVSGAKRVYSKPKIEDEELFERQVLQACNSVEFPGCSIATTPS